MVSYVHLMIAGKFNKILNSLEINNVADQVEFINFLLAKYELSSVDEEIFEAFDSMVWIRVEAHLMALNIGNILNYWR